MNQNKLFKKGPFTQNEKILINKALSETFKKEGTELSVFLKSKSFSRKELPKNFWKKISLFIPYRTTESIYDHVRRRMSSKNYQGKWNEQEIARLKNLVNFHGKKWTKIGSYLNRLPGACYDKWRDMLKNENVRKKGKWTQEERSKLIHLTSIQIQYDFKEKFDVKKIMKWTLIADQLGSRSYLQCRNEWARFFGPGSTVKLTFFDSYRLIRVISLSKVTHETEIKWDRLLKGIPAHKAYNKWKSLCKKILKKKEKTILHLKEIISVIKNKLREIFKKKKL